MGSTSDLVKNQSIQMISTNLKCIIIYFYNSILLDRRTISKYVIPTNLNVFEGTIVNHLLMIPHKGSI